jgi:methionyl aminopeptidase
MNKRKRRGGRVTEPRRARGLATALRPADRGSAVPEGWGSSSVRPGLVGLRRSVPPEIGRPPYAESGQPPPGRGRAVQTPEVIERMRTAGRLAAEVLIEVGAAVVPGITTDELDAIAHEATIRRDSYPSPLNYRGFPKSLCTSVNEVICHGIPDTRALVEGDIVNLDVTVYHDGVHGDTNATFLVGEVDDDSRRLVRETRAAMYAGIAAVRPGARINEIGRAIEEHANAHQLGVVREFIGHGIGEQFHGGLQILHYYEPRADTVIEPGMTFTIEPMITLGSPTLHIWDDGWTAVTVDGSRSAQFEHTMVVTDDGAELLTVTADGTCAADLLEL